ncbi:MAG TPA: hypothetical protein VGQ37_24025 [Vicinamibacterales bacterium]|jgi:hypothetical protein|nr:hypothetical protein [Vicinamibacterales bacterium]
MKRLATTLTTAAFALFLSSNAQALSITTAGVVGTLEGEIQGTSEANELLVANQLISMLMNTTLADTAILPPDIKCKDQGATCDYRTSNVEYAIAATIVSGGGQVTTGNTIDPSGGFTYALAKYDGPNAGYVLFYLPTFGYVLPTSPYDIWGDNTGQYGLSHYTLFGPGLNTCPENDPECNVTFTPDGGSTMTLLGSALLAIGMAARKFRSS